MPNKTKNGNTNLDSISRILKIIFLLHAKFQVRKEELLDELGVSERTLYRYKRKLADIGFETSIKNGIWIFEESNYKLRLDRVEFDYEELRSFIIAEKLIKNYADKSVHDKFKSVVNKIMLYLKSYDKKNEFNYIIENTKTIDKEPFNTERFPHNFLIDIQKAIAEHRTLQIDYYVYHKDKFSKREIIPIELNFYRNMWHINAFCLLKNDYREFRLDRIENLSITQKKFSSNEYTIEAYKKSKKKSSPEKQITVQFDKSIERLVHTGKYNFTIKEEIKSEKYITISFGIDRFKYDEFLAWILSWGTNAKIIKPREAINDIKKLIKNMNSIY